MFIIIFFQVSFEADLGSEPGYASVRGVHVIPGYCHPFPLRATQGTKTDLNIITLVKFEKCSLNI